MNKKTFWLYLLCACGTAAFYFLLQNIVTIIGWVNGLLLILRPFIVGGVLAFILNILLVRIRPLLKGPWFEKHPAAANGLSVLAVYLLTFAFLALLALFVVPPFAKSIASFGANLEGYYQNVINDLNRLSGRISPELWAKLDLPRRLNEFYQNLPAMLEKLGSVLVGGLFGAVSGLVGGVVDAFMGLLVSVYLLCDKNRMRRTGIRMVRALLPPRFAEPTLRVMRLTLQTFSAFFTGQLAEAFILGVLCFVGMSLLGFPYAPMISVIIGFTNLIPIVGPIVGTIPCALLLLLAEGDLLYTLGFVAFVIILQQLEANIIYPRVVGTQVGLHAFWVLAAVVVGGGLFGIMGMIVGIPALAVVRKLLHEELDRREAAKAPPAPQE